MNNDPVKNPSHYLVKDDRYQAIKIMEAWRLNGHLGPALKYILRAGRKDPAKEVEDLQKAIWYIERFIEYGWSDLSYPGRIPELYGYLYVSKAWKLPPHLSTAVRHIYYHREQPSNLTKAIEAISQHIKKIQDGKELS